MNKTARSIEELFPIIKSSKAGNLKAVKEWIDAGGPLNLPPGKKTRRRSPLQIAIERGFLTLTEMLLDGGADPKADNALWMSVNYSRVDIAELLLDRGVPLGDVSFTDVCYTHNLELIRLFLARGADPVLRDPFFHALIAGLHPLLGFFKDLLAKNPLLQPQADAVLAHYASKGNPRGVGLMMWAGANPNAEVVIDCDFQSQTPLEVAASSGNVPALKTMRPERFPGVLPKLLQAAAFQPTATMRDYLISIGAPINDSEDGSSSSLRAALHSIEWHTDPRFNSFVSQSRVTDYISTIDDLLAKGAKFPEMDARHLRRLIWSMPADELMRLLKVLHTRSAIPVDVLKAAISTPKMRTVLGSKWEEAVALLEPPQPRPANVEATSAKKVKPPPTLEEMQEKAERSIVNHVRNHYPTSFLEKRITNYWTEGEVRRRLKMTPEDKRDPARIIRDVLQKIGRRLRSGEIHLEPRDNHSFPQLELRIHPDATWPDVVREVCGLQETDSLPLTATAEILLDKLQKGPVGWISREKLADQIGKRHYYACEEGVCREILIKRGITIKVDEREGTSGASSEEVKLEIVKTQTVDMGALETVVNWSWPGTLSCKKKATVDEFRSSLIDWVVESRPEGTAPLYLFRVHTQKGIARILPKVALETYGLGGDIAQLLVASKLPSALKLAYDLSRDAFAWWVAIHPSVDWATSLKAIAEEKERPSYEKRFGLSYDAARLLEWIEALDPKDMLGSWTPVVEPRIEAEIGFISEWPRENIAALIQMLVDEINSKTDYAMSLQPWKEHGEVHTRVKVTKRSAVSSLSLRDALVKISANHGLDLSADALDRILKIVAAPR